MTEKYVAFARNERAITVGAAQQFEPLFFIAVADTTVVGVHVEIALAQEPNLATVVLPEQTSSAAGYARLVVSRGGNTVPLVQPESNWELSAPPTPDSLNDEDTGDTWAITPLALAGAGRIGSDGGGLANSSMRAMLSPKTKRKLRRGDRLSVEVQYSNGGNSNAVFQEVVTGTLFLEG